MLATLQAGNNTQHLWMIAAGLGVGFLLVTGLVVVSDAKFFQEHAGGAERGVQNQRAEHGESFGVHGGVDAGRDSATARQEKELERLHRIEKERANRRSG